MFKEDTVVRWHDGKERKKIQPCLLTACGFIIRATTKKHNQCSFSHLNAAFSSKYSNAHCRTKIVNVYQQTMMRWSLTLHHTSITPYVEFLMNSRLKKYLFIIDAVLVFWLLFFAFLKRLNYYLCAESLKSACNSGYHIVCTSPNLKTLG